MSTPSIPPYKPPKELQELLNKQALQRKRTVKLPKRDWIHRNPRLFQITFITASMLVFFSKPLYDAFIQESHPVIEEPIKFRRGE